MNLDKLTPNLILGSKVAKELPRVADPAQTIMNALKQRIAKEWAGAVEERIRDILTRHGINPDDLDEVQRRVVLHSADESEQAPVDGGSIAADARLLPTMRTHYAVVAMDGSWGEGWTQGVAPDGAEMALTLSKLHSFTPRPTMPEAAAHA